MSYRNTWAIAFIVLVAVLIFCGSQQAEAQTADAQSCANDSGDVAIAACTRAIRADPSVWQNYLSRGDAWNNKGDYDKAIADYNEAIRLNPKGAVTYNDRGVAWDGKGDYDKAIADHNEAIRLNPRYAIAYSNRGRAWNSKGDYDKAIADYNEAIRLDPKYLNAYTNRGNAWYNKGDYDKAIADYNEVIGLNPKYANAYNNRGNSWYNKKEYDIAILDYKEALRIDPKVANAAASLQNALAEKTKQGSSVASAPVQQQSPTYPLLIFSVTIFLLWFNREYLSNIFNKVKNYSLAAFEKNENYGSSLMKAERLETERKLRKRQFRLNIGSLSPSRFTQISLSFNFLVLVGLCCLTGAMVFRGETNSLVTGCFFMSSIILGVCFHEFGHALAALKGGDSSIRSTGYLTLDPLKYSDPIFSIAMPLVFLLIGGLPLPGGAVYINMSALRGERWRCFVSAAGVIANIVMVLLIVLVWKSFGTFGSSTFWNVVAFFVYLEIAVILFNLLPIPPLDGYGIISPLMSHEIKNTLQNYASILSFLPLLIILFPNPISETIWKWARMTAFELGFGSSMISQGQIIITQLFRNIF